MTQITEETVKQHFSRAIGVTMSMLVVLLLALLAGSKTGLITLICFGVLSACTVFQWVKYWKLFIDFQIEEKLQQFKRNKEDI